MGTFRDTRDFILRTALPAGLTMAILLPIMADADMHPAPGLADRGSIGQIDPDNLRDTVVLLERYGERRSWEKQWEAAHWAEARLKAYGCPVTIQTYEQGGRAWPNVIATLRGRTHPDEIIMAVAHLDSVAGTSLREAPGADDDATGVAAVLEIARLAAGIPLSRTVMLGLFTNEERGSGGSRDFARRARDQALAIRAVLNLDVLGYNRPGQFEPRAAMRSHEDLRHKAKAFYRSCRNFVLARFRGPDRIRVAGRTEHTALVNKVSQELAQHGVAVSRITGGGCA